MKQLKLLIKLITRNKISLFIRNNLNFKQTPFNFKDLKSHSVSDCFLWRTDNSFKTIFKFSDILRLFYNIKNSFIEIEFYSKKNNFIKKIKLDNLDLSNELIIDKKFLKTEDYGIFYINHFTNENIVSKSTIANRCYIGYSQNNNLYSFVHGNAFSNPVNIINKKKKRDDIINTTIFSNNTYQIQKDFSEYEKSELFFANPTSKKISISLSNNKFKLNPKECKRVIISKNDIINIISNCLFLRPTIFSYKGNFFDVHHS